MPLTSKGRKILEKFIKQYGKEEGERIFWSSIVSGTLPSRGIHKKGSGKIEKAKRSYNRKRKKK